ncbi:peptidyl-prolyl cis-trans isomerase [Candidatus Bathyarchaeota archaeon]|nr:peptidyl-prolyl cis-trans isomerase [Candidatus Bathyarchaeota archaeon]
MSTIGFKEIVILETSKGKIEIELNRAKAPITVENFVKYVKDGFFNGTIFHRVIPGFMVQGGGFLPDGTQKKTRSPINLEARNGLRNLAGSVAMARTMEPNSATSQFFINLVDNKFLDAATGNDGYAVFGMVISGFEIVKSMANVKTGSRGMHQDWPIEDVLIKQASIK